MTTASMNDVRMTNPQSPANVDLDLTDIELEKYMNTLEVGLQSMETKREKWWPTLKPYPLGDIPHKELMILCNHLRRRVQVERDRQHKFIKEMRKLHHIIQPFQRRFKQESQIFDLCDKMLKEKTCPKCGHKHSRPMF